MRIESATAEELLVRLRRHRSLAAAPGDELRWLATHGHLRSFDPGETASQKGRPVDGLNIVLTGHVTFHIDRGTGRKKVMEWRGGDVTGVLPYSRMQFSPGDALIEEPTQFITVPVEHLGALPSACPEVTAILVHVMVDRARVFNTSDLHDEKMVSLGKLASGLAHELNNPASAAVRSAKLLTERLVEAEKASRQLGAATLSGQELSVLERVRQICLATPVPSVRSPVEQADRVDAIAGWLERHEVDVSGAAPLADTSVTMEALDELAAALGADALQSALQWIVAGCGTRALALDLERSASRIYELVSAVKGFTYMDRPSVAEAVDLARGLGDTLAMVGSKAHSRSVAVSLELEPDLPAVRGVGGELNQIWANLIDNALDAAGRPGRVEIVARRGVNTVDVSVIDDGPGIPNDVRSRIFDPFFTTKPVGQGTGLGLDVVRRMVFRNSGEINVESRPGRTEFRVSLPVAENGGGESTPAR
jgi:signal transduction histidine kinase